MIENELKQRRGLGSLTTVMKPFMIMVRNDFLFYSNTRSVAYEVILPESAVKVTRIEPISACISGFFGIMCIVMISSAGLGAIKNGFFLMALLTLLSGLVCWALSGGRITIPVEGEAPIELYRSKSDEHTVERFIEHISVHRKKFLIEKYGPVPEVMERAEQLRRITWLKERNLLTPEEYRAMIEPLAKTDRNIGFAPSMGDTGMDQ